MTVAIGGRGGSRGDGRGGGGAVWWPVVLGLARLAGGGDMVAGGARLGRGLLVVAVSWPLWGDEESRGCGLVGAAGKDA